MYLVTTQVRGGVICKITETTVFNSVEQMVNINVETSRQIRTVLSEEDLAVFARQDLKMSKNKHQLRNSFLIKL